MTKLSMKRIIYRALAYILPIIAFPFVLLGLALRIIAEVVCLVARMIDRGRYWKI